MILLKLSFLFLIISFRATNFLIRTLCKTFSDDRNFLFELPRLIKTFLQRSTISLNVENSNEAAWSGPNIFLFKVTCFSIIFAPKAVAPTAPVIPVPCPENPTSDFSNDLNFGIQFKFLSFSSLG